MDTHPGPKALIRYIVLVPHRDAVKILDEYRQKLFAAGFEGALSFPSVSPLALVSRPFKREELKGLAGNIRRVCNENGGKFLADKNALNPPFFGPRLNLSVNGTIFPESAKKKILEILSPALLCAALVKSESPALCEEFNLSFRAAALANLAVRPLAGEYSLEWKLGPPVWLPAHIPT